jgi:hypothetical protein
MLEVPSENAQNENKRLRKMRIVKLIPLGENGV